MRTFALLLFLIAATLHAGPGVGRQFGFSTGQRWGAIAASAIASADATYDLGSGTYRWRDGFLSRDLTVGDQVIGDDGQFDTITNEAGTGAPSFSQGLSVADGKSAALADNAFISSAEQSTSAVVYRLHNAANYGFGTGSTANYLAAWTNGSERMTWGSSGNFAADLYPSNSGTSSLGNSNFTWNDGWLDHIYLQRTTATEGIIHGQGVTGDDELRLQITNTSGQYDRWGFLFATAPGQTASVTAMEVSSSAVHMPLGQTAHYATHAADDVITTNELWNGYTETTGTAVTLFTAVGNLGRRVRIVNEDAGGDDITVTSAGGNILVQTITVAAGLITLGFNADTAVDLVERGAGIDCISDNTNWQCVPLGMGIN